MSQMQLQRHFTANDIVQILSSHARRDLGVTANGRYAVMVTLHGNAEQMFGVDVTIDKCDYDEGRTIGEDAK